jgi:hypothetical protein
MINNEVKYYKGNEIKKLPKGKWTLNGAEVGSYNEAKRLVDINEAERKALKDIDDYVVEVCGGWL